MVVMLVTLWWEELARSLLPVVMVGMAARESMVPVALVAVVEM